MNDENKEQSLYERIGGQEMIGQLVEKFYTQIVTDDVLKDFFSKSSVEKIIAMQKEFFAAALGGPVKYGGMELSDAHHGRGIKPSHFKRYVDNLFVVLKEFDISEADAMEVIDRVNLYADDIVGGGGVAE